MSANLMVAIASPHQIFEKVVFNQWAQESATDCLTFCLLPSAFCLLPSAFLLDPYNFPELHSDLPHIVSKKKMRLFRVGAA